MFGSDYGISISLVATDDATNVINGVESALNGLANTASNTSKSIDELSSITRLNAFAFAASQSGHDLEEMGGTVVSAFSGILNKVMSVGSEFENFDITLRAMYDDAEAANQAMQDLMDLSVETPFNIDDIKDLVVVLKSQGLDAFKKIEGSVSGINQETIKWLGDLMAFKPDIPAQRWRLAFTNFLGSGAPKVLENALDMGKIKDVVGDIADTAEGRFEQLVQFIEAKNIDNLMNEQMDTFSAVMSNVEDQITFTWKKLADSGLYQGMLTAINAIIDRWDTLVSSPVFDKFLENFAKALEGVVAPLVAVANAVMGLVESFVAFGAEHPILMKWVVALFAFAGAATFALGKALQFSSIAANLVVIFSQLNGSDLKSGFKAIGSGMLRLVTLGALLYAAWKLDFMGLRTYVTNFQSSFKEASSIVSMETDSMRAKLSELANSTDMWDRVTANLTKGMIFLKGVVESFTLGDGFTISEDTWDKLQAAGMLPMFEDFLDTKYRVMEFIDSFKEGFSQAIDFVSQKLSGLAKVFEGTDLGDFLNNIALVLQGFSEVPIKQIQGLGNTFGQIAAYTPIVVLGVKAFILLGKAFSFLTGAIKIIGKPLSALFKALGGFSGIAKGIVTAAKAIGTALGSGLGVVLGFFGGIVTATLSFIDMLKNGFSWISEILMIVGIAVAAVAAFFAGIPAAIAAAVAAVIAIVLTGIIWVKDHFTEIKEFIGARIEDIKNLFTNLWLKVQETFTNIKNRATEAMENVKTAFNEKIEAIKGFFGSISDKASEVWNNLVQGASNAVDGIVSFFSSLPGRVNQFIEDIPVIGGAYKGVKSAVGGAVNAVKGVFGGSYATGGVFTEPSFIEVGEDGSEVVMPLEKNTGWINGLATNIGGFLQKNFLGTTTSLSTGQVKSINPKPVPSNPQPKGNVSPPPLISNSSNTSNADYSQTDNSVTFSAGAIVINVANATEAEAERLAELVMRKIQRKQQLNRMSNYKDINYQQPEFAY